MRLQLIKPFFPIARQVTRCFSANPESNFVPTNNIRVPRTSVSHPGKHNKDHIGLWYTIDKTKAEQLYGTFYHDKTSITTHPIALPRSFSETQNVIGEMSLMVRQPALTAIDYIKRSDLSRPPNKLAFYGELGSGKSLSMAHVLHYLSLDGWIIVHLSWPVYWRNRLLKHHHHEQLIYSTRFPDMVEHPIQSTVWLRQFQLQNAELLKDLELITEETHEFSKREIINEGSPLNEIIDLGLSRSRISTSCIYSLVTELKKNATAGRCKVAFVCDGINTLFKKPVRLYKVRTTMKDLNAQDFVIYQAFKQFLQPDWKNGIVVSTICEHANDADEKKGHLPRHLLGKNGWEVLDPFVPIEVHNYSDSEMMSAIDYYIANKWIQHPMAQRPAGRTEIKTVTGSNPWMFMNFVSCL